MLLAAVPAAAGGIPAGRPQDDSRRVTVTDLDGRSVQPLARLDSAARGAVFVFTRSDCPIANRYAPELERLRRRAAAASVEFWLVFVDPGESVQAIRAHLTVYGYTGRALHDPQHDLVRATGATIAPEAAAFGPRPRCAAARLPRTNRRSVSGCGPDATSSNHARSGGRDRRPRRGASSCTPRDAGGGMRHR